MIMSESEPEKEIIPKREMLISPLRNWDENSTELLAEYYEGLEMGDGATREGRFRIGEEMIRVYMEAGHYDEASSTAEAMIEIADGERDEEAFLKFKTLQDEAVRQSSIDSLSPKPN